MAGDLLGAPAGRVTRGWRSEDVIGQPWVHELTEQDRSELVAAARRAATSGVSIPEAAAGAVPLGRLTEWSQCWAEQLAEGLGVVLVRGVPVDELTETETELAYVALGATLGRAVGQDAAGTLLGHVRDERLPVPEDGDPSIRRYRTRLRQEFHTDGADVVGLLCLHRARSGGESRVVSSLAVHDEIARRRPDLLAVLSAPMHWDRNGEHGPNEAPTFELAPFSVVDGRPRVFYIGWYIRDATRHPGVPPLRAEQIEAMELLESIADDPAFHVEMRFEPGDLQWLNNATVLHAREAYEDDPDPARRRHLLRLWLATHRFRSVEDGLRRGINRVHAPGPTGT